MDNTERRKQLGEIIREAREEQHISQRKLSLMIGQTSHGYLSEVENGTVSVGFDKMCSIADALDKHVSYFFIKLS